MDERLQRLLKSCSDLPSLPAAAARVIELAEDPTASMADISHAVSLDPALATKLMRVANSPLYSRSRQVSTLDLAVMILGLNATIMLALSFSLSASMRNGSNGGLDYALFWRRSLLAAVAARVIAGTLEDVPTEDAFLASMLRDIGMIALDRVRNGRAGLAPELDAVDCVALSAWLLDQWHFPPHLVDAITASRFDETLQQDAAESDLARSVALSQLIADSLLDDPMAPWLARARDFASRHWHKDTAWLGGILDSVASEVPEIETLFDTDLMDAVSLEGLMAQAKELMMIRSLHTARTLENTREETEQIARKAMELEALSQRDHLTELWNRAYLDKAMATLFPRSENERTPLSVIFMDLDHFKQINDEHGHASGDEALKHTAQLLLSDTRSIDVVARYGGEEFVVVLPGIDGQTARLVAHRLLSSLRKSPLIGRHGEPIRITASAGVATHSDAYRFDSAQSLMRAADQAMYLAKTQGRDRFVVYSKCS